MQNHTDEPKATLPNGTEITLDDRESGQVYVVHGDPTIHDALPSVATVLRALPDDSPKSDKNELARLAQEAFQKRYMSQAATPPDAVKPFSPLYAQAREWARQGHDRESVMRACLDLNKMYSEPLDADMTNKMVEAAMTLGQSERYEDYQVSDYNGKPPHDGIEGGPAPTDERVKTESLRDFITRAISGGAQPDNLQDINQGVSAWHKWWEQADITEVIAAGQNIYHPDGYAGMVDAIVRRTGGEVTILNWEIAARDHPKHALKIGAYARAWEYVAAQRVTNGLTVRFDNVSGRYAESPQVNIPRAWQKFEATLRFHQACDTLHMAWFSGFGR